MELRALSGLVAAMLTVVLVACGTIEHWDPISGYTRWETGRPGYPPDGSNQYHQCGTHTEGDTTYNIMCDSTGRPRYAVPQNDPTRWIPIEVVEDDDESTPERKSGPVSDSIGDVFGDGGVSFEPNVGDDGPAMSMKHASAPVLLPEHYQGTTAQVLTFFGVDITDPPAPLQFLGDLDRSSGEATFIAPLPATVLANLPSMAEMGPELDFELRIVELYPNGNPAVGVLGLRGPVAQVTTYLQQAGFTEIHFGGQSFGFLEESGAQHERRDQP